MQFFFFIRSIYFSLAFIDIPIGNNEQQGMPWRQFQLCEYFDKLDLFDSKIICFQFKGKQKPFHSQFSEISYILVEILLLS